MELQTEKPLKPLKLHYVQFFSFQVKVTRTNCFNKKGYHILWLFIGPPATTSRVSLYHLRLSFLPQFHRSDHVYVCKKFLQIHSLANDRTYSYSLLKILIPRFCPKVFCNDEYLLNGLISDFDCLEVEKNQ